MLKGNNINISFKDGNKIIENFSFCLNNNDKLGIIGEEGNGKSTLLKYLYNPKLIDHYTNYSGSINLSNENIGYLPQSFNEEYLLLDVETFLITNPINNEIDYEIYNRFIDVEKLFNDFKLDISILNEKRIINSLSGGEKIKLELIKLKLFKYDAYLLDEPTNDLDIDTIKLIEEFILSINEPVILISHDVNLLTKVTNKIMLIERINKRSKTNYIYRNIGYSDFINLRNNEINKINKEADKNKKIKEEALKEASRTHQLVQNDLNRACRNPTLGRLLAKKMKNIKIIEKRLNDDLKDIKKIEKEEEINIFFDDDIYIPNSKRVLNLDLDILKAEDKILSKNIKLIVEGNKHITIIGRNGIGKSTLLKYIFNILNKDKSIKVGYIPQNYDEELNLNINSIDYLKEIIGSDDKTITKIMSSLGAIKFNKDEMFNLIKDLSGGQKSKLLLLKCVLARCNVLLLDEPTRNLSPLSLGVIINILNSFKGCLITISHDINLIKNISDEIYELSESGIKRLDEI